MSDKDDYTVTDVRVIRRKEADRELVQSARIAEYTGILDAFSRQETAKENEEVQRLLHEKLSSSIGEP